MPTTPRPKLKAPAPSSSSKARTTAGSAGKDKTGGSSPASSLPRRTPKLTALRDKVMRFYMMIGTVLVPFGRFIPQLKPVGENLKLFSEEAADAWIELAEEDDKVKKYLESITGASTWGNVIGIHFAILMGALPQQSQKIAEAMMPDTQDPIEMAKAMGMTEDELKQAFKMAEGIISDRPPEPTIDEMKQEAADLRKQAKNNKPGIVSPDELKVENTGEYHNGPQITGGL